MECCFFLVLPCCLSSLVWDLVGKRYVLPVKVNHTWLWFLRREWMPYGQVSFVESLSSLLLVCGSKMSGIVPCACCDAVMWGLGTCSWDKSWETSSWVARRMLLHSELCDSRVNHFTLKAVWLMLQIVKNWLGLNLHAYTSWNCQWSCARRESCWDPHPLPHLQLHIPVPSLALAQGCLADPAPGQPRNSPGQSLPERRLLWGLFPCPGSSWARGGGSFGTKQ